MIAPIALRELLVASRRPGSWRIRLVTTSCGLIIAFFALVGTSSLTSAGAGIFNVLTFAVFLYVAGAGFVLTADCIGEERRGGTFGLLYLTPLSSWDVIVGKLASSSVQGTFGLVAVVPMLFLSVLAGGVAGRQVFQVVVVLITTLFLSLTAGIFASAAARSRRGAIGMMAFLMIAPMAGGWVGVLVSGIFGFVTEQEKKRRVDVYWLISYAGLIAFLMWMVSKSDQSLVGSPVEAVMTASRGATNIGFLTQVAAILATALFYLLCATLCTEWYRTAREIAVEKAEDEHHVEDLFFPGLRSKGRVGDDPARWLLTFLQSPPFLFYIALAVMTLTNIGHGFAPSGVGMNFALMFVGMFPYLLFNFTLARFCAAPFHLLGQSGILEILMTTPLRVSELALAQRKIFWATLRLPFSLLVLASIPASLYYMIEGPREGGLSRIATVVYAVTWIISWLVFALHLEALAVIAMLHGSRGRKPVNAGMRAVALVMLPELAIGVVAPVVIAMTGSGMSGFVTGQFVGQIVLGIVLLAVVQTAKRKIDPQSD